MASTDSGIDQVMTGLGPLGPDEHAVLYGALVAKDPTLPPADLEQCAYVLQFFRRQPCPWCAAGLADHGLDFADAGLEVRCAGQEAGRALQAWYTRPTAVRPSGARRAAAWLLWIGIPVLSLGLLGWLMPLIAAFFQRRPSLLLGVALFLPFVVWFTAAPASATAASWVGWVALLQIAGSAAYGGVQAHRWSAASVAG